MKGTRGIYIPYNRTITSTPPPFSSKIGYGLLAKVVFTDRHMTDNRGACSVSESIR